MVSGKSQKFFIRPAELNVNVGIEYGDMQLIAEAYDILKRGLGLTESEIADIFVTWNKGVLDSFLIQITAEILKFNDDDGEPLVTKIEDRAQQKGTGKWTAINALDAGMPGNYDEVLNSRS
jgi:6-phosphogluconate dehydrogenase